MRMARSTTIFKIILLFPNFPKILIVSRLAIREALHKQYFYTRYKVPLYMGRIETYLKRCKVAIKLTIKSYDTLAIFFSRLSWLIVLQRCSEPIKLN